LEKRFEFSLFGKKNAKIKMRERQFADARAFYAVMPLSAALVFNYGK
jgi:hypothetical protein